MTAGADRCPTVKLGMPLVTIKELLLVLLLLVLLVLLLVLLLLLLLLRQG